MGKVIADLTFSITLLFGSIYLWFVADAFPTFARFRDIDADFWPKILLVTIGLLALASCSQNLSALAALRKSQASNPSRADKDDSAIDVKKLIAAAALVVLYFIGLQFLGFIIATAVFLALAINLLGYKNVLVRRLFPLIFTGLVTFIFVYALSMPLPRGVSVFETLNRLLY